MTQHLITEGHDSWVLAELWGKHLPNPKGYPSKEALTEKKFFKDAKGFDNVPRLISAILKTEGLTNLGIIVDANEKGVMSRWDTIKDRLEIKFGKDLLINITPDVGGLIIKEEGLPTIGVWIMPDNQSEGYLEHFLEGMIEAGDEVWEHARKVLKELPKKRFADKHEQKALVRTWLAWQKDPGLSYSMALKKGYFDAQANTIKPFVEWIASTFDLEPPN